MRVYTTFCCNKKANYLLYTLGIIVKLRMKFVEDFLEQFVCPHYVKVSPNLDEEDLTTPCESVTA